jgi:hypothetical protein
MRPGDDQLRGHDRSDTSFVQELEDERTLDDLALQFVGLRRGGLDPSRE